MSERSIPDNAQPLSSCELADSCAVVSDKLNNLLTAIQIRASLLLKQAHSEYEKRGLQVILQASSEATVYSRDLHALSASGKTRF